MSAMPGGHESTSALFSRLDARQTKARAHSWKEPRAFCSHALMKARSRCLYARKWWRCPVPLAGFMGASEKSYRLYSCGRCAQQVRICGRCDRGNRYCAQGCAPIRRRESLRRATQRYQEGYRGACKHAARQRAWRCRHAQKVTHQASIATVRALRVVSSSTATPALEPHAETGCVKPPPLAPCCCFCGGMLGAFARLGALGRGP